MPSLHSLSMNSPMRIARAGSIGSTEWWNLVAEAPMRPKVPASHTAASRPTRSYESPPRIFSRATTANAPGTATDHGYVAKPPCSMKYVNVPPGVVVCTPDASRPKLS